MKKLITILLSFATAITMFAGCGKEEVFRLIKVNSFEGAVTVEREEKTDVFEGMQLVSEDSVEIGEASLLELLADSDKHIVAEENTAFKLRSTGTETSGNITIDLLYGKSLFTIDNKLPDGSTFEVNTPNASLSVRGTIFSAEYDKDEEKTVVEVMDGKVLVTCDGGETLLGKGDKAIIEEADGKIQLEEFSTTDEITEEENGEEAEEEIAEEVVDGSNYLLTFAKTYQQVENYADAEAEHYLAVSDYVTEKTRATATSYSDKATQGNVLMSLNFTLIDCLTEHINEVNAFFAENKEAALMNEKVQKDVTEWIGANLTLNGKVLRVDRAVMEISITGNNVERDYYTSVTYKTSDGDRNMYYYADGVVLKVYGEIEEAPEVTTTTTIPVTTTTTVSTTTPAATTTVSTTTPAATTTSTTTNTINENSRQIMNIDLSYSFKMFDQEDEDLNLETVWVNINDSYWEAGQKYSENNLDITVDMRAPLSGDGEFSISSRGEKKAEPFAREMLEYYLAREDKGKAAFENFLKNDFNRAYKEDYRNNGNTMLTSIDLGDESDWLPESLVFESSQGKFRINVDYIKTNVYLVFDENVSDIDKEYEISDPKTGEIYYLNGGSAYTIQLYFYGTAEKIN